MAKRKIFRDIAVPVLKSPISSVLLDVFLPILYGWATGWEYRKILIAYLTLSLVLFTIYTIVYLCKYIDGKIFSSNDLFIFFPFLLIMLISLFLYTIPFSSYLLDPEKFIQDRVATYYPTLNSSWDLITPIPNQTIPTSTPEAIPTVNQKNNLLIGDCLSANTWGVYRDDVIKKKNNCWDIPGFIPSEGKLEVLLNKDVGYGLYGIYTPIGDNKTIKLNLSINQLEIPKGVEFSRIFFGIVPLTNQDPGNGMMICLQVQPDQLSNPLLKYRIPDAESTTTLNEYISLLENHEFIINLKDKYMTLEIDGNLNSMKFNLPSNPYYFWFGYQVEEGAIVDAVVNSITFLEE